MTEQGKLIDVRGVLQRNCTTTSVDELRSQGRNRVKVINAKQISALIEEAVARVLESRQGQTSTQEKEEVVAEAREEFKKLVAQREAEIREVTAAKEKVEAEREALRQEVAVKQDLERTVAHAQEELQRLVGSPNLDDLEGVLKKFVQREASEDSKRVEMLEKELSALRDQAVQARKEREDAKVERDAGAGAIAAVLSELKELKETMAKPQATTQAGVDASVVESLTEAMNAKLDKLGRKLGVASASDADASVCFDGLFSSESGMESNLEDVVVKERASGGIQDAVARMKAMRLGGKNEDDES